jgi:hypothetical protein
VIERVVLSMAWMVAVAVTDLVLVTGVCAVAAGAMARHSAAATTTVGFMCMSILPSIASGGRGNAAAGM